MIEVIHLHNVTLSYYPGEISSRPYLESDTFARFLSDVVHPFGASALRLSSDDELASSNFRFLSATLCSS